VLALIPPLMSLTSCRVEFATKTNRVAMNYTNYETAIVERLKVKLVGWTYHHLVSPSEIGTVDEIRTLRDALKTGACKWIRLSKRELAGHVEEMSKRRDGGEIIGKKRKVRSDKGKNRKRKGDKHREDDENSDEGSGTRGESSMAGPSKKKQKRAVPRLKPKQTHKSQLPPMHRSKGILHSESDSETEDSASGSE
jgi:hypothetical protein